ncbi:fructose-bisphosphate aldolase [Megasphaera cerevisiae DSM 20462]|uniref:Fructose-bisphosphate aldolase n=1 Tax=Megasphaera cerevisiae DSM 20462 TaxID=1122219 RepID=A0A0J6WR25_9FIRM|nr:class II fructose-bisphosphate aldolase [Megasphaera cerevisiae]KMO85905.1 fructose-bisphosphate aldolase [Megasphaera cerevisiae DSM 20462]SKA07712.1 tagatose 1,6-diphosphate aldolase GatY/KbaY [Megasphaera cerevisiae DSM 20462]
MALVNLKGMLNHARKNKYGVGAFDVSNLDMAIAVTQVAEEKKSPVILMGLTLDLQGDRLEYWLDNMKKIAKNTSVPVALHLDHATDIDFIKKCIDGGFSSVMFDGSMLPIEENIAKTKKVVDYAHRFGVTVEAELGHVGDGIVGNSEVGADKNTVFDNPDDYLTQPGELADFIDQTAVDCIAVAVGTAHGIYVHEPKIHFDRLAELNCISAVPMVMHGGSGTPDEAIKKSVATGICKLNIFSEMLTAFNITIKDELEKASHMAIWPHTLYQKPLEALQEVVRQKIDLVGSAQRIK